MLVTTNCMHIEGWLIVLDLRREAFKHVGLGFVRLYFDLYKKDQTREILGSNLRDRHLVTRSAIKHGELRAEAERLGPARQGRRLDWV